MEAKKKERIPLAAPRALLAGAIAGLLVLGIAGVLAARLLAAALRLPSTLSARSFLEPAALGLAAGALFGLLLPWLNSRYPRWPAARRLALGVLPFVASVAWMTVRRQPGAWRWYSALTLLLVLLLFLLYGWLADVVYRHLINGGASR
jgi:hypothetical protein